MNRKRPVSFPEAVVRAAVALVLIALIVLTGIAVIIAAIL